MQAASLCCLAGPLISISDAKALTGCFDSVFDLPGRIHRNTVGDGFQEVNEFQWTKWQPRTAAII
jgi:hypothetical protein